MKAFKKASIDGRGLLKKLTKIKLSEMGVKKLSERHLIFEEVEKIQNNWGYFQLPEGVVPVISPPARISGGGEEGVRSSPRGAVVSARGEGGVGGGGRRGVAEDVGEEGVGVMEKGGMGEEGGEGKEKGKKGKKEKKGKKDKEEKKKVNLKTKSKSNLKPLLTSRKGKEDEGEGGGGVKNDHVLFEDEDDEEDVVPNLVTFRFSQVKYLFLSFLFFFFFLFFPFSSSLFFIG